MMSGLLSGLFWGLDTSLLGNYFAISQLTFIIPLLLSVLVTYMHDTVSAIFIHVYIVIQRQYHSVLIDIKKRQSLYIMLGGLLGGPIGMCSYIASVYYIGPSITAIITSMYPAVGMLFSFLFLKEKRAPYQIIALGIAILLSISMWYTAGDNPFQFGLGLLFSLICVCAWGSEAVLCSYGMTVGNISNVSAICIRQTLSSLIYSALFLITFTIVQSINPLAIDKSLLYIVVAAMMGTVSYYFYYASLSRIGVSKTVALNISYSGFSALFSYCLFGYTLSIEQMMIGCGIVLSGIISAYDVNDTT